MPAQRRGTVLRTERLALTTWVPSDVDDLHLLHSDPLTTRYIHNGRPETPPESADLLAQYLREQARPGWTKWRRSDTEDQMIGRAGFGGSGRSREVAYALRRDHWGRGLASEIATALVRWHGDHPDASTPGPLLGLVETANLASCRVLEEVGVELVGLTEYAGKPCRQYRLPSAA